MNELTRIFSATHELEIDLIIQLHEAISKSRDDSLNLDGAARKQLDYVRFCKILPILGIKANKISASEYYLQCNRGQEYFLEWILDNTSRLESGVYKSLIRNITKCLSSASG